MWLCESSRSQTPDKGQPIRFHAEPNAHAARPPPNMPNRKSVNLYPMRYALILALLATTTLAAPPTTCGQEGEYERALCSYQHRNFADAEAAFRVIVERGEKQPATLRAMYFLARTLMKTGRFDEASALLIRIYSLDKAFYDAWNCDFLLGECRKALGR
jgi:TolA-binding protein